MRKDIGRNLQEDLLVLIGQISADDITKRNLIGLLSPDEMKLIIDYGNQINQIQWADRTLQLENEIAGFCNPIVLELTMKWFQWVFTFHWVIRHWNSKHRIPNYKIPCEKNPNQYKDPKLKRIDRSPTHLYIKDATKPLGELLCSILRVLRYTSSDMAEYNKGNVHYMNIFVLIAWEIYDLNYTPAKSGGIRGKADEISKFTKFLKSYRYKNWKDYREGIDSNRYPHLFSFIDTVVSTASRDSVFAKKFLIQTGEEQGLIEAFGSFTSSFRKPNIFVTVDSNEDEYTVNIGTGKAKLTHPRS